MEMGYESAKIQRINDSWNRIKPDGWGDKTHRRKREALYDLLDHDELLECIISGIFTADQSDSEEYIHIDGVVVATTKRVLAVDKGMFGKETVHSINYKDIGDIFSREKEGIIISGPTSPTYKVVNIWDDNVIEPFISSVLGHVGGPSHSERQSDRSSRVETIDDSWDRIKPRSWGDKTHGRKREALYDLLDYDELPECMIAGTFKREDGGGLFSAEGLGSDKHADRLDGVVVATNKRVLAVDKGALGNETVHWIDYEDIRDIFREKKDVIISGSQGESYKVESIWEDDVQQPFINYVLARMGKTPLEENQHFRAAQAAASARAGNAPMSVADEIEKLAGLLEKGILTQEEFDAKKKQLLGL